MPEKYVPKYDGVLDEVATAYIDKMRAITISVDEYNEFALIDESKSKNWPKGFDTQHIGIFDSEIDRDKKIDISQIVLHWTAVESEGYIAPDAIAKATRDRGDVHKDCCSMQSLVDKNGQAFAFTKTDNTRTLHAKSRNSKGQINNDISFGLEVDANMVPGLWMLSSGKEYKAQADETVEYTEDQIKTVIKMFAYLCDKYDLDPRQAIVSHEEIDSEHKKIDPPRPFVQHMVIPQVIHLLETIRSERLKKSYPTDKSEKEKPESSPWESYTAFGETFKPSESTLKEINRLKFEFMAGPKTAKNDLFTELSKVATKEHIDPILLLSLYGRESNSLTGTTSIIDGRPLDGPHLHGIKVSSVEEDLQKAIYGEPGEFDGLIEITKDLLDIDLRDGKERTLEEIAKIQAAWNQYRFGLKNAHRLTYVMNWFNEDYENMEWLNGDLQGFSGKTDKNVGALPAYIVYKVSFPNLYKLHLNQS